MEKSKDVFINLDGLRTVLQPAFTKFGDKFEIVDFNEQTRMYCYRRTTSTGNIYFEVFREITQESIARYPSSSDFGFGTALCIANGRNAAAKIRYYLANGFEGGRWRVQ